MELLLYQNHVGMANQKSTIDKHTQKRKEQSIQTTKDRH